MEAGSDGMTPRPGVTIYIPEKLDTDIEEKAMNKNHIIEYIC